MLRLLPAAVLSLLAIQALAPAQQPGRDWPQFRGPDRNGAVSDTEWSARGADKPLWSAMVGQGYSCPSIEDGRLVTTGYHAERGVDRIVCLDALTGAELWHHEFGTRDFANFHEGGTLSTPTIASSGSPSSPRVCSTNP